MGKPADSLGGPRGSKSREFTASIGCCGFPCGRASPEDDERYDNACYDDLVPATVDAGEVDARDRSYQEPADVKCAVLDHSEPALQQTNLDVRHSPPPVGIELQVFVD